MSSYTCNVEWTRGDAAFAVGIVEVVLRPQVVVSGEKRASDAALQALHHAAHARCNIAHSLRGEVRVQGSWRPA
jgi:organic hydroperoxide reductase OsmC/OhrA